MSLIKSKDRFIDHGEVFTPAWMVEAMLDLVKAETERIDSRFTNSALRTYAGRTLTFIRVQP